MRFQCNENTGLSNTAMFVSRFAMSKERAQKRKCPTMPASEIKRLLTEFLASGFSQRQFAKSKSLHQPTLCRYLRRWKNRNGSLEDRRTTRSGRKCEIDQERQAQILQIARENPRLRMTQIRQLVLESSGAEFTYGQLVCFMKRNLPERTLSVNESARSPATAH